MVDCDGLRCGFDINDLTAEALGVFPYLLPSLSIYRFENLISLFFVLMGITY
jgi:hypothetical protein